MDIPRRNVDFALDADKVPKDWATDPFTTTFLAALSMLFPEGERFFVESVKQHAEYVTDPKLANDVKGFIGQEAMHGKAHREFNELLVAQGFRQAPLVEKRLRAFLKTVRKVLPPKSQLAATCALEHFTAIMAEQLLTDRDMRAEFSGRVIDLWCWHALEETEHKAVAFDVYEAAGGEYSRRVMVMILATFFFFVAMVITQGALAKTRGVLWKPWTWRGAVRMWIYPAYFLRLLPAYLTYFKPGFHPNDIDASKLAAHWREQLFGEHGSLTTKLAA